MNKELFKIPVYIIVFYVLLGFYNIIDFTKEKLKHDRKT